MPLCLEVRYWDCLKVRETSVNALCEILCGKDSYSIQQQLLVRQFRDLARSQYVNMFHLCQCVVAIMFHRSIGNNCDSLWPNDVVNPSLQVVVMTWSMLSNLTWAATPRRRRRHPDHTHRSREGRSKCRTSFERKLPSRHDLGSCANHDSWVTMGNLGESKN